MDNSIERLRSKITNIDKEIIALLARRFSCAREIGTLKAREGRDIVDAAREAELRTMYRSIAQEHGISEEVVAHIFSLIIGESKRLQRV